MCLKMSDTFWIGTGLLLDLKELIGLPLQKRQVSLGAGGAHMRLTTMFLAFIDPYIFAVLPPGTIPSEQVDGVAPSFIPSSVVQVRSSISLANVQTMSFPPLPPGATPAASNYYIRLLTSSPSSKSPLYMIRTPIDRTAATAQGSAIWRVHMKSWGDQLDELVVAGSYLSALSLLDTLDVAVVPDKVEKVFVLTNSH